MTSAWRRALLAKVVRPALRQWRRSLQTRIVTSTALLGLIVVGLLGTYLYQQIGNGLERDRIEAAKYESQNLVTNVQAQWEDSKATSLDDLNIVARDLLNQYLAPPGPDPSRYVVMTRMPASAKGLVVADLESGVVRVGDIPAKLRAAVAADPARQQITITEIEIDDAAVSQLARWPYCSNFRSTSQSLPICLDSFRPQVCAPNAEMRWSSE